MFILGLAEHKGIEIGSSDINKNNGYQNQLASGAFAVPKFTHSDNKSTCSGTLSEQRTCLFFTTDSATEKKK